MEERMGSGGEVRRGREEEGQVRFEEDWKGR